MMRMCLFDKLLDSIFAVDKRYSHVAISSATIGLSIFNSSDHRHLFAWAADRTISFIGRLVLRP